MVNTCLSCTIMSDCSAGKSNFPMLLGDFDPTCAQHEQPVAQNEQSSVHKEPTSSQDVHVGAGVGNYPSGSGEIVIISPSLADSDSLCR